MVANLTIDATTVLRCATFANGSVPGNVINRTYIFEEQPTVASVFITGDPLQMFHADSGLFKNENFWTDKEIPVNIEFPKLKKFKSFKLRNNGNNFHFDYIRDMLASSITEGLGVDYQHGRASVVFYNGEYYGIHNIRESSNKNYYLAKYNLDRDQIWLLTISRAS